MPSQSVAAQGEAKLYIPDFKASLPEFKKQGLTVPEQGKAELCILDFKTTWSEFQKPSQTAKEQGEAEVRVPKPCQTSAT